MSTRDDRRGWARPFWMLVGTAVVTVGTIAVAGPKPWQDKLQELWTDWLSPRRGETYAPLVNAADAGSAETPPETADDGLDAQWEASPATAADLVPPPRERPPVRRLPALQPPVQEEPIQLTQLEEDPVPIVDRPPRAVPQLEPEPVPVTTPVRRTVPKPAVPEEPAVDVVDRPGLRETLAPIHLIEDKAARAKALHERNTIDKALELGDHPTALRELSRWYWRHPDLRHELHPQLEELAKVVYFSPRPHFYEPYVIQPNDRLQTVARKYQVPWEYLCRVNNVNAKKIRAGQKLKVVDGPFSAFVSLSNYELIVHHKGAFVRWYPVGVGKDGSSPVGTFSVKEKLVNPTYYGDDGLVAADDPKNPLGERWIDIGDSFGIHGTIDPASIGRNESRGCIRLLSEDIEELYDLLSVGSQVVIQR